MDKNSNSGVKVSVTLHFFLKTEMTHFHSPKKRKAHALSLQEQTTHSIFFRGPVSAPL